MSEKRALVEATIWVDAAGMINAIEQNGRYYEINDPMHCGNVKAGSTTIVEWIKLEPSGLLNIFAKGVGQ